ncbi:Mitochondrial Carrier (MC) protein [Phytophthora megakarya]|uniref:Mitochondrial Carrier (MC) protein n=1 Tax=Phytophthora megakarya TaxID=4795 RepID=A0A225V8H2_9STRA|nr:Mitochondrial Carrier (MC) protein [Phytophthora megakarya]
MKKTGKPVKVAAAAKSEPPDRKESQTCNICGQVGHIAGACPNKVGNGGDKSKGGANPANPRWGFSGALPGHVTTDDGIIDSGASDHLVRDVNPLEGWVDEDNPEGIIMPNGSRMRTTRRRTLKLP